MVITINTSETHCQKGEITKMPEAPDAPKPRGTGENSTSNSSVPPEESIDGQPQTGSIDTPTEDSSDSLGSNREPAVVSPEAKHSVFDVLRKKTVSIPIVGTVAAAAVLYAGVSRFNSNNSSYKGNQPIAAASVKPSSSATPTNSVSASSTASPEATPSSNAETFIQEMLRLEKYSVAMEKYQVMDSATFEALPRTERLTYAQYLMDETVAHGMYASRYGELGKAHAFEVIPVKAALDNTGQEILDNWRYVIQLSCDQSGDQPGEPLSFDQTKGREILSSAYYNVGNGFVTNSYLALINYQEGLSGPTPITINFTATDTSDLLSGTDGQGNAVNYKIITFQNQAGETSCATFVWVKFDRYDDSEEGVWLEEAQGSSPDNLKTLTSIK
jgi:hypothetical protein